MKYFNKPFTSTSMIQLFQKAQRSQWENTLSKWTRKTVQIPWISCYCLCCRTCACQGVKVLVFRNICILSKWMIPLAENRFMPKIWSEKIETFYLVFINSNRNAIQKMKFFIKTFFSKCDQIRSYLQIWSHLLKKSLIENFIFCAVKRKRPVVKTYMMECNFSKISFRRIYFFWNFSKKQVF